jgi:hypothetical protein
LGSSCECRRLGTLTTIIREKEVAAKEKMMRVDARNNQTLRSVLGKEYDFCEGELVRIDSNNSHDDY